VSRIPKYRDLAQLTDDALIELYDAAAGSTVVGTAFYHEELSRRASHRQNQLMLGFTKQMRNMTVAVTVLTVFNLVLVVVSVWRG
jgi:hypothetical protein